MMSVSEPKKCCQAFVAANVSQPTHWFATMEDQTANKACKLHPRSLATGGCRAMPEQADLGMAGTPCHPFSSQNAARFQVGAVEDHPEYGVAMSSFLAWLRQFEPRCTVFEQVPGFRMPFSKGSSDTPMSRFLVLNCRLELPARMSLIVLQLVSYVPCLGKSRPGLLPRRQRSQCSVYGLRSDVFQRTRHVPVPCPDSLNAV